MSQDNHLLPINTIDRSIERRLSDLTQSKPYGVSGSEPAVFREYLFVILKRKWLILSLVLVITSLVAIQSFRSPSIYQGETTIRIEQRQAKVLQTKDLVINGPNDPNFWGTQFKLLENPSLARQVVLTLDLQNNQSFFGGQAQSGVFSAFRRIFSKPKPKPESPAVSPGLAIVGESEVSGTSLTPEELARLEPYEDAIIENEVVELIPATNLVKIKYMHPDPELAQKISNTLAEVFQKNDLQRATLGTNRIENLLAKEIARLQTQIKTDQERQFNYARNHDLPLNPGTSPNLEVTRLGTLSAQLLDAQNERKNLQSQYEAAKKEKDVFSVPDVIASNRIEKLRDRISELEEKRNSLLVVYTKEWPEVQKLDAQINALEAELKKAPTEVLTSMERKYEAAVNKENMLRRAYDEQKGTTTQQTRDQIDLLEISQQVETNKQLLNTLLQRQREMQVNGDRASQVSISTYSRLPKSPIGPPRLRNILI